MLDLSIIEVTFTTMSPRLISSAARLKACSFSLVIPKIPSSSILIFLAIFAHLDVVVHLAYHQLLPIWMSVTLLTVEGEWNSKMPLAIFVLLTIGTLTLLILILLKFFMKQTDGALKQDCGGLTLTLEKRCHFPRRDWKLFFLLSSCETRSWLSYDHSRISRRERDYTYVERGTQEQVVWQNTLPRSIRACQTPHQKPVRILIMTLAQHCPILVPQPRHQSHLQEPSKRSPWACMRGWRRWRGRREKLRPISKTT